MNIITCKTRGGMKHIHDETGKEFLLDVEIDKHADISVSMTS